MLERRDLRFVGVSGKSESKSMRTPKGNYSFSFLNECFLNDRRKRRVFFMITGLLLIGSILLSGCSQILVSPAASIPPMKKGVVYNSAQGNETGSAISDPVYLKDNLSDSESALQEKKLQLSAHWPVFQSGQAEGPSTGMPAEQGNHDGQALDPGSLAPTPAPDPPGTPIHPFYEAVGIPPTAPGLAMRHRTFDPEPSRIAYLTIDDGPYPETTPKILAILKKENVHATFFVVGRQAERYPELLKAEYEAGNAIGNHTYSHNYSVVYPSPKAFLADIKKNEDIIERIIGVRPAMIRAPGGTQGHFHVSYYNAIDAAGYLVYDWNVSTGDADAPLVPVSELMHNIVAETAGKSRVIILMHDVGTKTTSVEALPGIIEYLKSKGFAFGVLSSHVAPILFPGGFTS